MASAWPRVAAALAGLLPNLPGWSGVQVIDGPPNTDQDFLQYMEVGYQDGASGGAFTQGYSDDGYFWEETGEVTCRLVVQTGDDDYPTTRSTAFTLLDALQTSLQQDRSLGGVLSADGWSNLTVDPQPIKNSSGTAMSLGVTLHYFTRL